VQKTMIYEAICLILFLNSYAMLKLANCIQTLYKVTGFWELDY